MIKDPNYLWIFMNDHDLYHVKDDRKYLDICFEHYFGHKINWANPETFNEKLQWLKINDRCEEYTELVDKIEVKKTVSKLIGEKYVIPTLATWDNVNEVNFDILPNQFVLKCTHNSGLGMCICKDKSTLNKQQVLRDIRSGLHQNYYYHGREWPYKNIQPRIIVEKYLDDPTGDLVDYKFFCFNGIANCVMVCTERFTGDPKFYFFDKKWNLLRLNKRGKEAPKDFSLPKPSNIDEMFEIAEILAQGFKFVRVDLYDCDGKIYFGELTFYPDSGFDPNLLPETDMYFGKLIKL